MKLPPLSIGPFVAQVPLIQGGMSIRVSTSALAIPVADCGGIGTIGGSSIPIDELKADIQKAKSATKGIIAVNIMFAMKNFYNLVKASIEAGVGGSIEGIGSGHYDVSADVPLPTIGLYATLALTDRLSVGGRAGFLSLNIDDDEGTLYDLFASADYFFTKNFGIGIGYKFVRADVKVQKDTYRQLYDIRQSGPVAYVTFGFGS